MNRKTNKWIKNLLILYVVLVIVRYVCAIFTSTFPIVGIDEYLYYSLGRSIATEGRLLFRGQNANYAYILYPLILAPIYLIFPEGANFYRLIQLWNIILMSASVFPLFYLGREVLKSDKKAFFFTVVSMILPDFILGQLIFTEAILYPLFFTLMYCVYKYFQNGTAKYLLWSGLTGGLLYSTKPGAVTPAVVFLLIATFNMIRKKERKGWTCILGAVLILVVIISGFMLLARYGFDYQGSALSIYEEQIGSNDQGLNLNKFFNALFVYPYYFILACGIIGFVYPAYCYGRWTDELKRFWRFIIISLGAMCIGSAWTVERTSSMINMNLRYVAMYIPITVLFCVIGETAESDDRTAEGRKSQWMWAVIIGYTVVCTLVLGCKAGAQTNSAYALMSLSVLNNRVLPLSGQSAGNIIILILCAALVFLFIQRNRKWNYGMICIQCISIFMLINSVLCYSYIHVNYRPEYAQDGPEVHRLAQGKPYLYIYSKEGIADIGVDISTKSNNCFVYMNDFMNSLRRNDGIYKPYVPEIARGMADVHETPDIDTLVVDYDSFPMYKFSENTSVSSPNDQGHVYVVRFTPGKRLADSSVGNILAHSLDPNKPGILLLYDEDLLGSPLTVRMDIYSEAAQTMTMNSAHELYTAELSEGRAWYEISFNKAEDVFNFMVPDKEIKLYAYELISAGG